VGRPRIDDEDDERPPSPRTLQAMRERYRGGVRTTPCGCGSCGLHYPIAAGRRFHPECPSRSAEPAAIRSRSLIATQPKPRRCELCEDMPHRRSQPVCPVCDRAYAEEPIAAPAVAIGCALGGL
jgi:hypothetical protein